MPALSVGDQWTWSWTPFHVPATFGDNPVVDWLRVIAIVAAVLLVLVTGRVYLEQRRRRYQMEPGQPSRFFALALAAISLASTEVAVMGTPGTPRLVLTLTVDAVGLWGVARMRRQQHGQPVVRD